MAAKRGNSDRASHPIYAPPLRCSTGGQSCPEACSPRRSGTDLDSDASGFSNLSLPVGFTWDLQQLPSESPGQEGDRGDAETDGPQPRDANLNYKKLYPGRLSDVWSAVSHDFDTNQTTITVPPLRPPLWPLLCRLSTAVTTTLSQTITKGGTEPYILKKPEFTS